MSSEAVFEQVSDSVAVVVAVDGSRPLPELTAVVDAVCARAEADDGGTAVVLRLRGALEQGREWPGDVSVQAVNRWERALRRLERLPTVSIATAEGPCAGPALDVLLAVDLRIAAPDLVLMPPVNDGHFWPGVVLYRLVRHLGVARARQIVLWGVSLSVEQAAELGIVDEISPDVAEATRLATLLNGRIAGRELAVRRRLLLDAPAVDYQEALGAHLAACDRELRRLRPGSPGEHR